MSFIRQLFMCLMSVNFRVPSTAPITYAEFALSVVVVDIGLRVESCGREKPLRGECSCRPAGVA
jgi:hypothetical protein